MRNLWLMGSEWLPNRSGGLNRYFHGLAHAVADARLPAEALVTFVRAGQTGPIPLSGMAQEGAPLQARLRGARAWGRRAALEGMALLNAHFALYAWPCLNLIPQDDALIVNFHGPWADEMLAEQSGLPARLKAAAARAIEKRVYRRAHRCITLSSAFAAILTERYGISARRISVIPGGADLSAYERLPDREEARRRLGWPEGRPTILSVRRLARRMGLDRLIEAASRLRCDVPELLVLIAGAGPAETDLRARIASLGLEGTVQLLGFLPDDHLPIAYAAADVSAMPSVSLEGFGLTLVESLAAGTPAVGAPVGGIPEVLEPLDTRLVARHSTSEAIAQALLPVLTVPDSAPDPAACRAYAARFAWAEVFPAILQAWRDAGAAID
ncbi:MAG: glycosyltransferase family 4 protein [Chthonomonadales bacterium]|nr:glycosyltransferase family 4 protein [Chthonomonadales bacterium]